MGRAIWKLLVRTYKWASEAYNAWGLVALFGALLPAALMGWTASQVGFLWNTLGWFGVGFVVLFVWVVVTAMLSEVERIRYQNARRLFIARSLPQPETKEQKQEKTQFKSAIAVLRNLIAQSAADNWGDRHFRDAVEASSAYWLLRPRMPKELRTKMATAGIFMFFPRLPGSNLPGFASIFANELDALERRLGLYRDEAIASNPAPQSPPGIEGNKRQ